MTNQPENLKLTVSIPPKSDDLFRKQAFNGKITLGELFLKYQETYLEKQKELKEHNRLKREYDQGKKITCPWCGSPVIKK